MNEETDFQKVLKLKDIAYVSMNKTPTDKLRRHNFIYFYYFEKYIYIQFMVLIMMTNEDKKEHNGEVY